jgi:hypothetical protein
VKVFVRIYAVIAVASWIYLSIWGASSGRGWAFNLGSAVVWPAVIFPSVGKAIGGIVIVAVVVGVLFFAKKKPQA